MSDTPRTDVALGGALDEFEPMNIRDTHQQVIERMTEHARTIERELAAADVQIKAIRWARDQQTAYAVQIDQAARVLILNWYTAGPEEQEAAIRALSKTLTKTQDEVNQLHQMNSLDRMKDPPEGDASVRASAPTAIPDCPEGGAVKSLGPGASPPARPNSEQFPASVSEAADMPKTAEKYAEECAELRHALKWARSYLLSGVEGKVQIVIDGIGEKLRIVENAVNRSEGT